MPKTRAQMRREAAKQIDEVRAWLMAPCVAVEVIPEGWDGERAIVSRQMAGSNLPVPDAHRCGDHCLIIEVLQYAAPGLVVVAPPGELAAARVPDPLPAPASETTLTMERTERPRPCCSACSCPVEAHSAATARYLCTECFAGDVWAHLDRFSRLAGPLGSRVCESFKAAAPARLDTCSECNCAGLRLSPPKPEGEKHNG